MNYEISAQAFERNPRRRPRAAEIMGGRCVTAAARGARMCVCRVEKEAARLLATIIIHAVEKCNCQFMAVCERASP